MPDHIGVGLLILVGCPAQEIGEHEFMVERERLLCDYFRTCGLGDGWRDEYDCEGRFRSPDQYDVVAWRACGATYNGATAARCLQTWQQNGIDCTRPFHSGCAHGEWYDGACDIWDLPAGVGQYGRTE